MRLSSRLCVMMPPMTIVSPSGTLTEVWIVRVILGGGIGPEKAPLKIETSSVMSSRR